MSTPKHPFALATLAFVVVLFIGSLTINAQKAHLTFYYSTVEQGLSNYTIRSIMQDSRGSMRVDVCSALKRHDGTKIKI